MIKADPSRKRFEQPMRVMTGAFPTDKELFAGANQLQAWSACRRSDVSGANSFTRRHCDVVPLYMTSLRRSAWRSEVVLAWARNTAMYDEPGRAMPIVLGEIIDRIKSTRSPCTTGTPLTEGFVYSQAVLGEVFGPEDQVNPWWAQCLTNAALDCRCHL